MLAKTSVEGHAVSSLLLKYLWQSLLVCFAWIQILDPQAAFQIELCVTVVCCDSQSNPICLSPGANPQLCKRLKVPPTHFFAGPPPCFSVGMIKGVAALSLTLCRR